MKKNVLNKKLALVLAVVIVIALMVILTACPTSKNADWTKVYSNMNNVKSLTCKIVMTDKTVNVYDYTKTVTVDGSNATVTVVEVKLGDGFEYQTDETEKDVENVDKSTFMPINLSSPVMSQLKKTSSDGYVIYSAKIEEVFINQIISLNGDLEVYDTATLTIKCKGNNAHEITLDYVTKTGRVVSVVYTYAY